MRSSRIRRCSASAGETIGKTLLGQGIAKSVPSQEAARPTSNTRRKATVAYPTIKRILIHMHYVNTVMNLHKLLKSHEML